MSKAPRRFLDDSDDLNSVLRGALKAERADDVDRARLDRIGRGVASVIAGGAASAPMHAAMTPKALTAAPSKVTWLASKGPFVLIVAASISGIAAIALREPPAPAPVAAPPVEATATTAAEPVQAAPEPPTMSPADLPSAPVTPSVVLPAKPVGGRGAQAAAPSSDVDEIALLARAHEVLHADPARSIALCREHERRWPSGHFAQERDALGIEALVYLARRDEAARRWATFRERYPSSSHLVHLDSLFAAKAAQ